VVVDFGGYPGRVGATAEMLSGPLPAGRSLPPELETLADNVAYYDEADYEKEYDVSSRTRPKTTRSSVRWPQRCVRTTG